MGRQSRRRAELRQGLRVRTFREERRRAEKAEQRGRRLGNSLSDYEKAVAADGPRRVYEALISRHNQRMKNVADLPLELRVICWDALAPLSLLDVVLFATTRVR